MKVEGGVPGRERFQWDMGGAGWGRKGLEGSFLLKESAHLKTPVVPQNKIRKFKNQTSVEVNDFGIRESL